MRRIVVLVVAGVGLAAAKERKRGYLRGVGNIFRNKASTQRNRALKHLAKLDREVAAMKSERARNRKIQEREGHAAEEEEHSERRRLSVFSASARRKRAAGHLRQVEKRHAHDPHPGVTGQLEYDHPVSYRPQMILNSEVMEQMYETNPEEAAKYVFVSKMPGEASWKTDAQRAAEAAASSSQHLRK